MPYPALTEPVRLVVKQMDVVRGCRGSPQKFRQASTLASPLSTSDIPVTSLPATMSLDRSARPLARCLQCTRHNRIASRSFSTTLQRAQEETTSQPPSADPSPPPPSAENRAAQRRLRINPETVSNPKRERWLVRGDKPGQHPIGSRRRRAALASSARIPFHELPYQCFQEARKVLKEDRAEKVAEIEELRAKIAKWKTTEVPPERQAKKELQIQSWKRHIERLKIFADINDPLVKKNFEDGFGKCSKTDLTRTAC